MNFTNQSSKQLAAKREAISTELKEIAAAEIAVLRKEKQYQLLVTMDTFTREQSKLMPDFELADKARATTLLQMFTIIGDKLGFVANFPLELANKSVAQVLHILDYIDDYEKLNALDYQEGTI